MADLMCCHDCGSLNVGPIESDDPDWLLILRGIPGWDERGILNEYLLWKNNWAEDMAESELEVAAESFASVQSKTLKGYTNMVAAFKSHVRKGYHKTTGGSQSNMPPIGSRNY